MNRALFLDRDGVINHDTAYLYRPADVVWVDGIFSLCRTARELGWKIVVVTNQSGIGRGLYGEADFRALMAWMGAEFLQHGAMIDAVYFCPYHPRDGVGEYRREHPDRKPGPGMLLRAAGDLDLDLADSVLIGDRCTDVAAAHGAGLRKAFLLRGTETSVCAEVCTEILALVEVEMWLRNSAS